MDLIYLLSLLHSKTTFYREVDIDHNKEIYETTINNLDYLNNYYTNLITSIEKEVYMSPSSYLIARNINITWFNALSKRGQKSRCSNGINKKKRVSGKQELIIIKLL